jgi:hypothetical protein
MIILEQNMVVNHSKPFEAGKWLGRTKRAKRRGMIAGGAACMQDHHRIGGWRIRQSWQLRAIFSAMLD